MRKTPFNITTDKFKLKPHISSNDAKDDVAKELLFVYGGYFLSFVLWLVVSYNYIPMVFYLGAGMWILGGISAWKLPQEAPKIANKTRFTVLSYVLGLVALRCIVFLILKTPKEIWCQVLLTEMPEAVITSVTGFLSMTFVISMFMGFIGYLNYIMQLFTFHRTSKTVDDHMIKIMRKRGEENNV